MSAAQRHIEAFLEMLGIERGASANTIDAYRRDLASYSAYLSTRDRELLAAEAADVSGWLTASPCLRRTCAASATATSPKGPTAPTSMLRICWGCSKRFVCQRSASSATMSEAP